MQTDNSLKSSDKFFWHGYIEFYEQFFKNREFKNIAEIGVFKGNSIRWLLERFHQSKILAGDILSTQPEWPVNNRVQYVQMDQGNRQQVEDFFATQSFDLIIDDGSHLPQHQVMSLIAGWDSLEKNGIYILEDIHTNFGHQTGNAMTVLLAINHCLRSGLPIDPEKITESSYMTPGDAYKLSSTIKSINFFRRTQLPLYCYLCKSKNFNYTRLKCQCGVDLFNPTDSMTCVIEKI